MSGFVFMATGDPTLPGQDVIGVPDATGLNNSACVDACRTVYGTAYYRACTDRCAADPTFQPVPMQPLALPSLGEFTGALKWVVVGIVAFAIISVTKVV